MMTATSTFAVVMPTTTQEETVTIEAPKYVFYLIGDGLGFSQRQMAEYYLQSITGDDSRKLVMDTLPVSGINTTYSADSLITDSAAAGTALACGIKTANGVIAEDLEGNAVTSLIEAAEAKGMKTGLVSTTRITHATPATFASHNSSRDDENGIALDYVDSGVDFIAGGGARHFLASTTPANTKDYSGETMKSKRKDDVDVIAEFEKVGYSTYIGKEGTDALMAEDFADDEKVFAVLTNSHLPYEIDRQNLYPELPSIGELTD
ncbi:MAG: alkaline phosphatase, partial [Clostridia bacterium]|nr:alkaline phosphatase [Clostridia bacterium]